MSDSKAVQVSSAITPDLQVIDGSVTTTSQQVAAHFGKRHADVMRAIRKMEIPSEDRERNFALTFVEVAGPNGAMRKDPSYRITRDGFTLLAMGFTGKEAMRWKLAYITTFNAMEAKLRALYVSPLLSQNEFRNGIKLQTKLKLMEQSRTTMQALVHETNPHAKRNLYWQLRQINDTLGIPTDSAEQLLGMDAPLIPVHGDLADG